MSKFSDHVTSQAFALTLSRPMCKGIEFLMAQELAGEFGAAADITYLPLWATVSALEERGLITTNPTRLTTEGRLLYPLLVHAGLVASRKEMVKSAKKNATLMRRSA